MPVKKPCEFCQQPIDPRGYQSHITFRHAADVVRQFRIRIFFSKDPHTRLFVAAAGLGPKLLKAAN